MKRNTLIEIIAALFILMFVYTAVSKFLDIYRFKISLGEVPLVVQAIGLTLIPFFAYGLILVEIVISVLLFFPKTRKIGLWSSLGLMLVFTGYLGYLTFFVDHLPCTCGGVISEMTWVQHFYFNIFFILLAVLALWLYRKEHISHKRDEIEQVVFT